MLVVKYGGNAMNDGPDAFIAECAEIVRAGGHMVLVHGGGPQIDAELRVRGIAEHRIAGLRVTDAQTLEITEKVLIGQVNKQLVRAFHQIGIAAVGLSGQDAGLLTARAMQLEGQDLGFVGEVEEVDPRVLHTLLDAGFVPVIAPLGISRDGKQRYNLNADSAAGALAGALGADPYVVITDVPRVRREPRNPASAIDRLTVAEAHDLEIAGAFDGGMLPKMHAIFAALQSGAKRAVVAGGAHALHKALAGDGTIITP